MGIAKTSKKKKAKNYMTYIHSKVEDWKVINQTNIIICSILIAKENIIFGNRFGFWGVELVYLNNPGPEETWQIKGENTWVVLKYHQHPYILFT